MKRNLRFFRDSVRINICINSLYSFSPSHFHDSLFSLLLGRLVRISPIHHSHPYILVLFVSMRRVHEVRERSIIRYSHPSYEHSSGLPPTVKSQDLPVKVQASYLRKEIHFLRSMIHLPCIRSKAMDFV